MEDIKVTKRLSSGAWIVMGILGLYFTFLAIFGTAFALGFAMHSIFE